MKNSHGPVGSEMAKNAVLAYTQIRREDAEFTSCQRERDAQGEWYHLTFDACMLCYECYVDAATYEVCGLFSAPGEITVVNRQEARVPACA